MFQSPPTSYDISKQSSRIFMDLLVLLCKYTFVLVQIHLLIIYPIFSGKHHNLQGVTMCFRQWIIELWNYVCHTGMPKKKMSPKNPMVWDFPQAQWQCVGICPIYWTTQHIFQYNMMYIHMSYIAYIYVIWNDWMYAWYVQAHRYIYIYTYKYMHVQLTGAIPT